MVRYDSYNRITIRINQVLKKVVEHTETLGDLLEHVLKSIVGAVLRPDLTADRVHRTPVGGKIWIYDRIAVRIRQVGKKVVEHTVIV